MIFSRAGYIVVLQKYISTRLIRAFESPVTLTPFISWISKRILLSN